MDELRACVCGDASVSVICDKGDCGQSRFPWSVTCGNYDCDWEFGWFATREEAINKWNHRASDEVIRELVEALEWLSEDSHSMACTPTGSRDRLLKALTKYREYFG